MVQHSTTCDCCKCESPQSLELTGVQLEAKKKQKHKERQMLQQENH